MARTFGNVKHRKCSTCGRERAEVLFPRLPNRARSKVCQLCKDTAPKDVLRYSAASRLAWRRRKWMEAAE